MKNWPRGVGALLLAAGVLTALIGLALASSNGARAQASCGDLSSPCNTLAMNASAGDTTIRIVDDTGFEIGDQVCVDSNADTDCTDTGDLEEPNQIDGLPTGFTIILETALAYDHGAVTTLIVRMPCELATPTPTPTPTATATPTATGTPPATGTATPTATATPPATATGTPAVTTTPTATATKTPPPAATATPAKTATPAATAVPATATPKAPPPTGMGSDGDGGSTAVYGLLALGGLLALAGAALVWRFRSSKA